MADMFTDNGLLGGARHSKRLGRSRKSRSRKSRSHSRKSRSRSHSHKSHSRKSRSHSRKSRSRKSLHGGFDGVLEGGLRRVVACGSRASVLHGNAGHTTGGLRPGDLFRKNGRIKSRAASLKAKQRFARQMQDPRFAAKWNANKIRRKSRKSRESRRNSRA